MARRSQTQRLNIWMNGLPVGYWEKARDGDRLSYFDKWLGDATASHGQHERIRPAGSAWP